MSKLVSALFILFFLACQNTSSFNGRYLLTQRIKDPKTPLGGGLIDEFEIKEKVGYIKYLGTTFKTDVVLDHSTITMDTKNETGVLKLYMLQDGNLKGEGWIAGIFKKVSINKDHSR